MCGTSMASPFVAGLAALLLQRDPSAGPADIKKLLKANSHIPGKKAGTHSTKWGYGFIDTEKLQHKQGEYPAVHFSGERLMNKKNLILHSPLPSAAPELPLRIVFPCS